MSKAGKIAVVLVLAVVVVVVMAMKKGRASASAPPAPAGTSTSLPRLVDLGSTTCVPCKMLAPILEDLKRQYAGQMQVDFIDVNQDPDAAKPFNIKLIPTQVFFNAAGKELWRHEGFIPREDILAKLDELGVKLNAPAGQASSAPASAPAVKSGST